MQSFCNMWSIFLIALTLAAVVEATENNQTKNYHGLLQCCLGDDACLANDIEEVLKILESGNRVLNIPPLNPFAIEELNIPAGKGVVHEQQHYKDSKLIGLTTGHVENAHLNIDKGILSFSNVVPKFIQKGKYEHKGTILDMQINGNGSYDAEFGNMRFSHTIKFTKETKSGETYLKLTSYDLQLAQPDYIYFSYENLHNGNPELSKKINQTINDYSKEIFNDVGQNYARGYAEKLAEIVTFVFEKIPLKDFYDEC